VVSIMKRSIKKLSIHKIIIVYNDHYVFVSCGNVACCQDNMEVFEVWCVWVVDSWQKEVGGKPAFKVFR